MLAKYKNDLYQQITQLAQTLEHNKRSLQERTAGLEEISRKLEDLSVMPEESLDILHQLPKILKKTLQTESIGVVIMGAGCETLLFNKTVEKLLGTDIDQVESGRGPIKIFKEDRVTAFSPKELPWRKALAGKQTSGEKVFIDRPDVPEGLWVAMECMPVVTPENEVSSVLVLMTDITEHYHLDGWLKKVVAGLDSQIKAFEGFDHELKQLYNKVEPGSLKAIVDNLTESDNDAVLASPVRQGNDTVSHEGKRILLVDDIRVNLRLLGVQLKTLGFTVDTAHNGVEALEMIRDTIYDAVLMDCDMPVMDGYEATRRLRKEEAGTGKHLPIIALTAYDRDGDKKRCLDCGMDYYLVKGVNARTIIEVMETYAFGKTNNIEITEEIVKADKALGVALTNTAGASQSTDGVAAFVQSYGKELGREIMLLFLRACSGLISSLDFAIDSRDEDSINHFVYSIKGPAASIGARGLVKLCSEILKAAGEENWSATRVAYDNLVACYLEIQKIVGKLLADEYGGIEGVDLSASGGKQHKSLKDLIGSDKTPVGILGPESNASAEMAREVAIAFFDDTAGSITTIKRAIAEQKQEELRFESHKLTGCAKVLDARGLAQTSRRMEEIAQRADWKTAMENYLPLVQEYNQASTCLKKAMELAPAEG